MYAVRVKGHIPDDVEAELESRGIKYRSRDHTDEDWFRDALTQYVYEEPA